MSKEWDAFVVQLGGVIGPGKPTRVPDSVSISEAAICDLSYRGLICVRGSEAQAFLARQFSSDILSLTPNLSQLSGYCSAKGRLLAIFRVFMHAGAIYLEMPRSLVEPTLKRLRMFVLRADVTLEDSSDTLARVGLFGAKIPPMDSDAQLSVIPVQGLLPRFEIIGHPSTVQQRCSEWVKTASFVDSWVWEQQDILAGIPVVFPETIDAFVPQMVNLQLVGGVSFTKGCYPGQEIVARTQYLGTLKRRMYLLHSDGTGNASPGDQIFSSTDREQKVGIVVHAYTSAQATDLLAVVEIQAAEAGDLSLGAADGPSLRVTPLPYGWDQPV